VKITENDKTSHSSIDLGDDALSGACTLLRTDASLDWGWSHSFCLFLVKSWRDYGLVPASGPRANNMS
jgi:hypothetical protein